MSEWRKLLERVLSKQGNEDRYRNRKKAYPRLDRYGNLPSNITTISNDSPPWYCHGLAFRMATYPDECEKLFSRWEELLCLPEACLGWPDELQQWTREGDHWAEKWDKFYQFLWLLQSYEYFRQPDFQVTFPFQKGQPAPDFRIETDGGKYIFVESTVLSKWWFNEAFLEDVLALIGEGLSILRVHNIARSNAENPFSVVNFSKTLERIAKSLTPDRLESARTRAAMMSPVSLYRDGDVQILVDGKGEYQPNPHNVHGDPMFSQEKFFKEIIRAKKGKNNLKASRPNVLLVNSLGIDFQTIMLRDRSFGYELEREEIDEIWLASCGIDRKLRDTQEVQKIFRRGYLGSGL